MSASRKSGSNVPASSRVLIGANRSAGVTIKAALKIGINRQLGKEAREAEQVKSIAARAAALEADDRRLLEAAATVTKPSIFTRLPPPKDINPEMPSASVTFSL